MTDPPRAGGDQAGNVPGERFRTLDGLRGIAAMTVVIHHTLMVLPSLASPHFTNIAVEPTFSLGWFAAHTPVHWFWGGREAVWVFFVLSGFVLTRVMMRVPRQTWRAYYPSRLLRLYVPVVGAVLLGAVFIRVLPDQPTSGYGGWMRYGPDVSLSAMVRDATTMRDIVGPIRPLWSLRWEVLFSLLLPIFFWGTVVWRRGLVVKLAALLVVVYIGAIVPASPLIYLPMFAVGALMAQEIDRFARLARGPDRGHGDLRWWILTIAGLTLLTSTWSVMPFSPSPKLAAISQPAGLAGAAVLVFVALFWPRARRVLERPAVQWLGAVSFSLYLVHEPIAVAFGFLVGDDRGLLAMPLTIVTSLVVAAVFQRLIERPSHRLARRVGSWIDGDLRRRDRGVEQSRQPTAPTAAPAQSAG